MANERIVKKLSPSILKNTNLTTNRQNFTRKVNRKSCKFHNTIFAIEFDGRTAHHCVRIIITTPYKRMTPKPSRISMRRNNSQININRNQQIIMLMRNWWRCCNLKQTWIAIIKQLWKSFFHDPDQTNFIRLWWTWQLWVGHYSIGRRVHPSSLRRSYRRNNEHFMRAHFFV